MPLAIALDFESTGLLKSETNPYKQPGIVEIGAVRVKFEDTFDTEDTLSTIIDPELHYEEEAQKITGIRLEETKGQPNLREFFPDLSRFFLGVEHLITFNGPKFDIPLLQYNLLRYGLECRFPWPPIQHDVMTIATDVLNLKGKTGNKYPNLGELYKTLFGAEYSGRHRAYQDAKATMDCAMKLRDEGYILI